MGWGIGMDFFWGWCIGKGVGGFVAFVREFITHEAGLLIWNFYKCFHQGPFNSTLDCIVTRM